MKQTRIMIVDDQNLFASSLRVVLESYRSRGLLVTGVAHDGRECIDRLEAEKPDMILMDVRMAGLDGVEATKIVHERHPEIKIMMLTTFDDDTYVYHALQNGATGYILKNIEPEELITCIKAVSEGSLLVSSSVGYRLFSNPAGKPNKESGSLDDDEKIQYFRSRFPQLKRREAEVLCLVLQGMDNHEISQKLFIAEQTIKNYTSSIYAKIGVQDRLHAIQLLGSIE